LSKVIIIEEELPALPAQGITNPMTQVYEAPSTRKTGGWRQHVKTSCKNFLRPNSSKAGNLCLSKEVQAVLGSSGASPVAPLDSEKATENRDAVAANEDETEVDNNHDHDGKDDGEEEADKEEDEEYKKRKTRSRKTTMKRRRTAMVHIPAAISRPSKPSRIPSTKNSFKTASRCLYPRTTFA
jgi:hypothetical protein